MMKKHVAAIYLVPFIIVIFLYSCTKPFDEIKNRTWEGQIYRSSDDKQLSDVRLEMSNDTLYLFSNAIFGSENDTLILQNVDEKDSTFIYKSLQGNTFSFKLVYEITDKSENLYFVGNDFYIVLGVSSPDLWEDGALSFYESIIVPRESFLYLDGAYEGEVEMENQFTNLFLAEMGGVSMKLVFVDGFKVKIYVKNLYIDMFSGNGKPTYDIVNYKVVGNKLYLDYNKSKVQTIDVKDYGETLVMENDEANIVMHKIY